MAAKDYEFYPAALGGQVYLAKKTKTPHLMSKDRRIVTDNEIIGLFEHYLRRFCAREGVNTINITDANGRILFTATLKDTEDDTVNKIAQ